MKKFFVGLITGISVCGVFFFHISKSIESSKVSIKREEERKRILEKWFFCWIKKIAIDDLLLKKNINKIIIYGAADFGIALKRNVSPRIECCCFIDKDQNKNIVSNINVIHDLDHLPSSDAIIVTAFDPYREIKMLIEEKSDINVIYLEELIDEMYTEAQ